MNRSVVAAIGGACAIAFTTGCTPVALPPLESDVPGDWRGYGSESGAWPDREWWRDFGSDELIDLMERVEARNLDLQTSDRKLRQAQIALTDAGLELFGVPRADLLANGSWSGTKIAGGDFVDGASESSASISVGASTVNLLNMPARHQSIVATYDSAVVARASIRLSIRVAAAAAYFRVLLTRDRIDAARRNLDRAEAIARITQARVDAGVLTPIDGLQQQIQVQHQHYALAELRHEEFDARTALAELLTESGRGFTVEATTLAALSIPRIAPGMPSALLVRRPDIVQAELTLLHARANVAVARSALFPRISLTGTASRSSDALRNLVSTSSLSASVGLSVVQTVFDFGRRKRATESARLEMETTLANYRQTVIKAFNSIDVLLGRLDLLTSQEKLLQAQLTNADESLRIAEARYREGVIEYLSLLTAQQSLYSSRNALLGNKISHLNALLSLYQALGGGWSSEAY